jgi:hypothetical protein
MDELRAESFDGRWVFEHGKLRSGSTIVAPFTIEWFERWTYARFLPGGELVLAFETGQPYGDWGSYGYRMGGVQVLAQRSATAWALLSIEYQDRMFDERFVPRDVCWSSTGLLAYLHADVLEGVVLRGPRAELVEDLTPQRDSEAENFAFGFDAYGTWDSLEFDPNTRTLTAIDADGFDLFDLEHRRCKRAGGEWEPLLVYE